MNNYIVIADNVETKTEKDGKKLTEQKEKQYNEIIENIDPLINELNIKAVAYNRRSFKKRF